MTKAFNTWTVQHHGPVNTLGQTMLTVVGEVHVPTGPLPRRMTVVRLAKGGLVIFSAVALNDEGMRRIENFGEPGFLIVPNDIHRLDAKIYKQRYPNLRVIAPEGARVKVEEVVPVDASSVDFDDPNVTFVSVAGTLDHEAALVVREGPSTTLIVNDLIGNIRDSKGFGGWLLRRMGFAGDEPQIPTPVKFKIVSSKSELRRQLVEWSQLPGLERIVVSHGSIITDNPRGVLVELADTLK